MNFYSDKMLEKLEEIESRNERKRAEDDGEELQERLSDWLLACPDWQHLATAPPCHWPVTGLWVYGNNITFNLGLVSER